MFYKKGVSAVVTTVILVVLVLVLVSVVWGVVNNLVTENLESSSSCFGNFEKVEIEGKYTYYDENTDEFQFSVSMKDIDIEELVIVISTKTGTKSYTLTKEEQIIEGLETYPDIITSKVPDKNSGVTYIASGFAEKPDSIKVAPVINGQQCEASDSLAQIETGRISSSTTCANLGGACCSSIQFCEGGTFQSSSDCSSRCCVGGTCTNPCTISCSTGPGCRTSLANGIATTGECCGTGSCYTCNTGYNWNGTACVATTYTCTGSIPTQAISWDSEESTGLTSNRAWAYSATDTTTKCQYHCNTGYTWSGTACIIQCTDTCSSLGYNCGTQTICGVSVNCGTCGVGNVCASNGQCTSNIIIIYATSSTHNGYFGGRTGANSFCTGNKPSQLTCSNIRALVSVTATDEIRDYASFGYSTSYPLYWYNPSTYALTKLANNFTDALDNFILTSARVGTGLTLSAGYWTGSTSYGSLSNTCTAWGSTTSNGTYGHYQLSDGQWISYGSSICKGGR